MFGRHSRLLVSLLVHFKDSIIVSHHIIKTVLDDTEDFSVDIKNFRAHNYCNNTGRSKLGMNYYN